jgi:hypothetical protein
VTRRNRFGRAVGKGRRAFRGATRPGRFRRKIRHCRLAHDPESDNSGDALRFRPVKPGVRYGPRSRLLPHIRGGAAAHYAGERAAQGAKEVGFMPANDSRRNGKRRLPTAGEEDVRVDPKTADADDREAAARARAADGRQRGM